LDQTLTTSPTPDALRAARNRAGLTQTEAARLVHSKLRAWQKWEWGESRMHPALWELFSLKTAPLARNP
jgi:putative transcriptional regulator